jgi:response regulator RpfG family c-di-GMP phosphodiesterase
MPGKDGMEVAKEILTINPDQRIIFASAYVKETLENSVKELKRVVELLQKPFEMQAFIDTIEDKQVYDELKKIMINIRAIDYDNTSSGQETSEPFTSRERMRDLFECLRKIQKNRTF